MVAGLFFDVAAIEVVLAASATAVEAPDAIPEPEMDPDARAEGCSLGLRSNARRTWTRPT